VSLARCYVVNRAGALPFQLEDAARPDAEVEASQASERPFPRIGQEQRLDHRWVDLRVPANNAIMRLQSAVCQLFREALYREGFVEIHTPKIISGESEGGSGVFRTDYFGSPACLAQSPQLYKQMAIASDLGRVFEVGPVFRAENSNTRRHLCEFTGLDIEMAIDEHYDEVLLVAHRMFKHMFEGLEARWPKELKAVREQYSSEPVKFTDAPCVVHWPEGIAMLRGAGVGPDQLGDFDDLSTAQELLLGQLVKEKYGTDFYIMDRYPTRIRPFYTMSCADDERYSNSYDMFIRGQEICSGAQRCHDPAMLRANVASKGIDPTPLAGYLSSFEHGMSPHGGAGIGLERVVFLCLGLDNVRKASMFPRDPSRCTP
jgi:aspartyl-tRNA synthetase